MNYVYLAKKYLGVDTICNDRTFDGLIWPESAGPKPSKELFEAFQVEENRQAAIKENAAIQSASLMEERQHQARVKAAQDARSLEEKIAESESEIREEVLRIKKDAIELQERIKTREVALECWNEIGRAQELINEEAEKYLLETDWYVTRKHETGIEIPEEVSAKRKEARDRINHGITVYAKWRTLREKELPSKEEIRQAIKSGGDELENMKKLLGDVLVRYRKPKVQRSY